MLSSAVKLKSPAGQKRPTRVLSIRPTRVLTTRHEHYVEFVEALMYGHFVKKQVKRRCSMPHRTMASVGVLAAALVVVAFAAIPLAGQTPTVAAQASKPSSTWTLPRTPDGKPDLQGTWLNFDQTPFEQP